MTANDSRFGPRARSFASAVLLAFVSAAPAAAQTFTYTATGGSWSTPGNWQGGAPPSSGASTQLVFSSQFGIGTTDTNDLGNPFQLSGLTLNGLNTTAALTVTSAAGNSLSFVSNGAGTPFINYNRTGAGGAVIGGAVDLSAIVGVGGTGAGTLTFSGAASGTGGLSLNSSALTLALNGDNSFAGGVTVNAGTLSVGSDTALGGGTLTINGGTISSAASRSLVNAISVGGDFTASGSITFSGNVDIGSSLRTIYTGANGSATFAGVISGSGGLSIQLHTLSGNNTFTGGLTVFGNSTVSGSNAYAGTTLIAGGGLKLNGNGRIANSSAYDVRGYLNLDNTATNRNDRVAVTSIVLTNTVSNAFSGVLSMDGNAGADSSAVFTSLTINGGYATVQPTGSAGHAATFSFDSLQRTNYGTVRLEANHLGAAAGTREKITFTTAPALVGGGGAAGPTTLSIIPFAVNDAFDSNFVYGRTLVTYDAVLGARSLTNAEYAPVIGLNALDNVRLTTDANVAADATINALVLAGGWVNIAAGKALTVTSGTVVSPSTAMISGGTLNFGTAEGIVFASNPLTISSVVSGSGGLTKSGFNTLTLSGNNTYAGGTNLAAGALAVTSDANLGAAGEVLRFVGGGLTWAGAADGSIARNASILNYGSVNVATVGTTLTLSNPIAGAGVLEKLGNGRLALTAVNSHAGGTTITNGILSAAFDAALGDPAAPLTFNGSGAGNSSQTLQAGATFSSARPIRFTGAGMIDTNGFDITMSGPVSAQGTNGVFLTKMGAGTLSLTGAGGSLTTASANPLNITGGTFRLAGAGSLAVSGVSVNNDAALTLDNSAGNASGRLGATGISFSGGNLNLIGSAAADTSETLGTLTMNAGSVNRITVTAGTDHSSVLNLAQISGLGNNTGLLIRGTNLGALPGANTANVFIAGSFNGIGGGGAAGSANMSLLPGTLGDASAAGGGGGLLTYDAARGLRLLTPSEFASSITGGLTSTNNVQLASGTSISGSTTINSLVLGAGGGVSGPGSLRLESGNLLALAGNAGINVAFLTNVMAVGTVADLTVQNISAANVMTKFGAGTLTINGRGLGSLLQAAEGTVRLGAGFNNSGSSSALPFALSAGTTLDFAGNSLTIGGLSGFGSVTLGAGTMTVSGSSTGAFSGVISGTGGVTAVSPGTGSALVLAGANAYSGLTTSAAIGGLAFSGAGSALNSSGFIAAGDIRIDDSSTPLANRLGDSAPVTLRGATLKLTGHAGTAVNEAFGTLTLDVGQSTVSIVSNGVGVRFTADSLVRHNNALLFLTAYDQNAAQFLRNIDLGFNTAPALVGGGGATLTSQSILPYALGDTGSGSLGPDLVTYSAGGFRRLNSNEYATTILNGSVTANNVRLTTAVTGIDSATAINALVLAPSSNVSGNGTLTVTSGAVAFASGAGSLNVKFLDFGSAEGVITTSSGTATTINSIIGGSGGLTIGAAFSGLTLAAANTYTGTTTLVSGTLKISADVVNGSPGPLGAGGGPLVLAPGTAAIDFNLASPVSVARDIIVRTGGTASARITVNGTGGGTMSGNVSLERDLWLVGPAGSGQTFSGNISGPGNIMVLSGNVNFTGNNTGFAGGLTLNGSGGASSVVGIGHDNALGTGTVTLNGSAGTMAFQSVGGARTISNAFAMANTLSFQGTNDLTINGVLSGNGGLTKNGSGTLTLGAAETYTGITAVNTGVLRLAAGAALPTNSLIRVAAGASIQTTGSGYTLNSGQQLQGNGSVNGNLTVGSTGTISPGNSPGAISMTGNLTLAGGGVGVFEFSDLTQAGGVGWDQVTVAGVLDVAASPGSPFSIQVKSLGPGPSFFPGSASGFNPAQAASWHIITTTGGVTGFSAGEFALDMSQWQNGSANNFYLTTDGMNLDLAYSVVPVPEPAFLLAAVVSGLAAWRGFRRRAG